MPLLGQVLWNETIVLPLRAIACQVLFLWVAIAIEAAIFHRQLGLSRRVSLYYAVPTNLVCVVLGWLVFFYVVDLFPRQPLVIQAIGYIFTGRFVPIPGRESVEPLVAVVAIAMFLVSFFLKSQLLYSLQSLKVLPTENLEQFVQDDRPISDRLLRYQVRVERDRSILIAHGASSSAVFLLSVLSILGMQWG